MRKSLHPLEPREVDSARTYDALINAARTQIIDCHRLITESKAVLAEIEDEKKGKKGGFFNASTHKKREAELAEQQIHQQQDLMQQLKKKIANLDSRLETLAKKAGLSGSAELLKHVNEYSSTSVAVRDIEAIDQVLSTRESIMAKGKQDLRLYFEKAGRHDTAINADAARSLASDVARFIDETRRIDAEFVPAIRARQELEQISTEINDTEGLLESMFMRSNLPEPANLNASYEEFQANISLREKLFEIKDQLRRWKKDTRLLNWKAPERCLRDWRLPGLAFKNSLNCIRTLSKWGPPSASGRPALSDQSELEFELEQKAEFIRAAMNTFDAGYLETIRDLDRVDYDLTHLRQARAAIELSRETLQRLSNESSFDIMSELNGIANNLSVQMGFDFASVEFAADLQLAVRLKNSSHVNIDQLSASEKAKAHLLARMSVCQLLASKTRLPFVLDEVLSEFDDETFLRVMKFLFELVAQGNQVIMFSNQRLRYEWLMQNLTEEQKQLIAICRKGLLRADPVTS